MQRSFHCLDSKEHLFSFDSRIGSRLVAITRQYSTLSLVETIFVQSDVITR